jgi:hypothetical protein
LSTRQLQIPEPHRRMRSARRLLVIAATIAALSMLVPTASASSHKAFHLAKTCEAYPTCVVTASNDKKIPVGTEITYSDQSVAPNALLPTIHGRHGTSSGVCDLTAIFANTGPGLCVFGEGTGSLTGFRVELLVTFDGTLWYWDNAS